MEEQEQKQDQEQKERQEQEQKERNRSRSNSKDSKNNKKNESTFIKNFNEILEECKKPRNELLFKITSDFDNEANTKKYIMSMIKSKAIENDIFDIDVIEYKKIETIKPKREEFLYFRLNNKITLNQVYIKSKKRENLPQIKIIQLRPNYFFEDNY